ncbi:MAG: hypothetical protein VKI81_11305, partial [Synechococcaceae cyanobacterium]|nr:hypothetical protein [Synechococcaceae cyanobacterium]
ERLLTWALMSLVASTGAPGPQLMRQGSLNTNQAQLESDYYDEIPDSYNCIHFITCLGGISDTFAPEYPHHLYG